MSALDVDRPAALRSPHRNKRLSYPGTSLSHAFIADALSQSPDNGASLVLHKKNLADIGEDAAQELATIGRETTDDESSVERHAQYLIQTA